ncbi:hypothetical protein JAAARDRAFT_30782 [Jaapia argillacea MUCL 33604]|uniref:ZZ-type domain-containing protein n=1 Tax=Jaapia argillacea MUCL 33604 TaxID=933084 RepID=A0A067Q5D9_9AGAM|nr:hypothetical protein JAAARDRAFT_30782 [Jaapia argillacea MUCL 33604]
MSAYSVSQRDYDSMQGRADRPLVVKCTFDRWNKRITFASARNCSYDLLRDKIEQCFSLSATSYVLSYKDDDGEVTDITTESDLTEAIAYFQAGSDDPPLSSAASILSGRSFGSKKITLRVQINVDYDGPSLSDTSSLASMDEYRTRSKSEISLSFSAAGSGISAGGAQSLPPDDDSVTISSRDTGVSGEESTPALTPDDTSQDTLEEYEFVREGSTSSGHDVRSLSDIYNQAQTRFPVNPSTLFHPPPLLPSPPADTALPMSQTSRGAAWLRDQNARTIKAMLGALPAPSDTEPSDTSSISLSASGSEGVGGGGGSEGVGEGSVSLGEGSLDLEEGSLDLEEGSLNLEEDSIGLGEGSIPSNPFTEGEGELALERDPRGKYYYAYMSSNGSQSHDSGYDDSLSVTYDTESRSEHVRRAGGSGTSGWVQRGVEREKERERVNKPSPSYASHSEPTLAKGYQGTIHPEIPPEVLQFLPITPPPPEEITTCSECGVLLDSIRYVCSTCGEKKPDVPGSTNSSPTIYTNRHPSSSFEKEKGKTKEEEISPFDDDDVELVAYPPHGHRTPTTPSTNSSRTFVAEPLSVPWCNRSCKNLSPSTTGLGTGTTPPKPLPPLPPLHLSTSPNFSDSLRVPGGMGLSPRNRAGSGGSGSGSGSGSSDSLPSPSTNQGYELCSGCIESAGVTHALEATFAPGSSPGGFSMRGSPGGFGIRGTPGGLSASPVGASAMSSSPGDLSQWRRSAPKLKGTLRHAYLEKAWGPRGWENVEQDTCRNGKCSTCNATLVNKRYKCASCQNFNICIACYGLVHEVHPSHAFLVVPDVPSRSHSDSEIIISPPPAAEVENGGEPSMKHPGVKCAHCLQDIVGARFHCAICESVDICANCESAGLPGNLDSADGGHISSHIMIKIPFPLESTEVEIQSRRALNLWTGRDAASVGFSIPRSRSRAGSIVSSYARTVIGSRKDSGNSTSALDHQTLCNNCGQNIVGFRYYCAMCPSFPASFNLCANCEVRSYAVHDPNHVFLKLPRPVDRPLEAGRSLLPPLYKQPVASASPFNTADPKEYLKNVVHPSTWCDRCMTRIQGIWFRCAYCDKDLCDDCEKTDTHDNTHCFLVFKSPVDMRIFRNVADLENPTGMRPIIPGPIYFS